MLGLSWEGIWHVKITFFLLIYSLLAFPLRIDPLIFQARCRKKWQNMALVYYVYFRDVKRISINRLTE